MNELIPVAHLRLTQLLISMLDAAKQKNKEYLVQLINMFEEDYDGLVDLLASEAGLSDDDIKNLIATPQDAEALTQAAMTKHGYRLPVVTAKAEPVLPSVPPQSEQTPPQ